MPPTSSSTASAAAPVLQSPQPSPPSTTPASEIRFSRQFSCSLCTLSFTSSTEQREHMRGEWHVHNLKLKMQSLATVSESAFLEQIKVDVRGKGKGKVDESGRQDKASMLKYTYRTQAEEVKTVSSSEDDEEGEEEDYDSDDDEDEDDDDEEDYSTFGSEEEETRDAETLKGFGDGKETLFLPSGRIVGRKNTPGEREHRRTPRKTKVQAETFEDVNTSTNPSTSTPNANPVDPSKELIPSSRSKDKKKQSRALAERHAAGLVGLSDKQRSVLAREEKKMMSLEGRERGGFAESVDRKGNSQKHYRIGGSRGGKKMGGLEKRLG